ncbi:hypothetical protein CPB84DRAFT_1752097 [Gymnopilus junonius]|uniref:Uncharacterized protein n=1 Tax=Gymnopilus junonius TaxID=109634 RepID=A0A9P5NDQ3_GYMJU|nr:hypothetical protein CPB84DRAFT_1752097 [Gymnopilus junonius]
MAKESQTVDNEDQTALKAYHRKNVCLIHLAEKEAEDCHLIEMGRGDGVGKKSVAKAKPKAPAKSSHKSTADSKSSSSLDAEDDSGSAESEDDLPDPRSMTDEQIAQLLGGENPVTVQTNKNMAARNKEHAFPDLFNIRDEDIDMVSLHSSSRASTHNSEPPSSEFIADSSEEDEVESALPVTKCQSKAHSVMDGDDVESEESEIKLPHHWPVSSKQSKHEQAFHKEQPKVVSNEALSNKMKSTTGCSEEKDRKKADEDEDTKWGAWARIVRNKRGKANLLDQHSTLRLIIYKAIKITKFDVLKKKAWPEQDTS